MHQSTNMSAPVTSFSGQFLVEFKHCFGFISTYKYSFVHYFRKIMIFSSSFWTCFKFSKALFVIVETLCSVLTHPNSKSKFNQIHLFNFFSEWLGQVLSYSWIRFQFRSEIHSIIYWFCFVNLVLVSRSVWRQLYIHYSYSLVLRQLTRKALLYCVHFTVY